MKLKRGWKQRREAGVKERMKELRKHKRKEGGKKEEKKEIKI